MHSEAGYHWRQATNGVAVELWHRYAAQRERRSAVLIYYCVVGERRNKAGIDKVHYC